MSDARRLLTEPSPGPWFGSHAEYYAWADTQPRGRFERAEGQVFAMAPERGAHLRRKLAVVIALREAAAAAGVACQALPDGATVEVGEGTNYEPDALVNCGPPMGDDEVAAPNPVVVVEVPSPSSRSLDAGLKLADYFRVPSIRHYLIVGAGRRLVVHHRRGEDGGIETRLLTEGAIALDPPGITVTVEALYRDA